MLAPVSYEPYLYKSYDELNCWQLVYSVLCDALGLEECPDPVQTIARLCEAWFKDELPIKIHEHDVLLIAMHDRAAHHVGIAISSTHFLHSTEHAGVKIEPIERWHPYIVQIARHQALMTYGEHRPTPPFLGNLKSDMVMLREVYSPIPARAGHIRETIAYYRPDDFVLPELGKDESRIVYHNGLPLDDETTLHVRAGDEVLTMPSLGNPGQLIVPLVSLAVGLGIQVLSNTLFKPKTPSQLAADGARSDTFAGPLSRFSPGGSVPILYGRRRIGLDFGIGIIEVVYQSRFIDKGAASQITRSILDHTLAPGEIGVFGQQASFTVQITGSPAQIFPRAGQRVKLSPGTTGNSRAKGTYRINRVKWPAFDRVIIHINNLKHFSPGALIGAELTFLQSFEVNATSENATLNLLGLALRGPISALHESTIEINKEPIDNFPEVAIETRLGTTPQLPIDDIVTTPLSIDIGQEYDVGGATLSHTSTSRIDRFVLNIDFNNGLIKFTNEGKPQDNRVTIEYRYQQGSGSFSQWRQVQIVAKSLSPVRTSIERAFLATDFYTIETRIAAIEQDDPAKGRFQPTLTTITESKRDRERYNGYALVWLSGIPADRVDGDVPNVTIVADGTPCRVGSFSAEPRFSDNPAWCTMDFLTRYTQTPDSKISLAAFQAWADECDVLVPSQQGSVPTGDVAIPRQPLPVIDQSRDTQTGRRRKHTMSYLIESPTREQTIVQEMMSPSRTELIRENGLWFPKVLRDELPSQLFNTGNMTNVSIRYTKDIDNVNVVDLEYNDKAANWERVPISYPKLEDQPADVRRISIDGRTIDNFEEALTVAQFELKQRQLPRVLMQYETNPEGFSLQPFDLIYISHSLPGWGESGRVAISAQNSTTTVVLDQSVNIDDAGGDYHLYIRFSDDSYETRPVVNPGVGEYGVLAVSTPYSQAPLGDIELWSFGRSLPEDTAVLPFRVIEAPKFDQTSGRMQVQCLEHVPNIYSDDPPTPPPPITILPTFRGLPPAILDLTATEFNDILTDGTRLATVLLSWDVDRINVGDAPYDGAVIQRRRVETASTTDQALTDVALTDALILASEEGAVTDFETVGDVRNGLRTFTDASVFPGDTYQYKVVPVSNRRVVGYVRAAYVLIQVSSERDAQDLIPPAPQNLRLVNTISTGAFESDAFEDSAFETELSPAAQGTEFEGPEAVFTWDIPKGDTVFASTQLIYDFCIEVWGTDLQGPLAFRVLPAFGQSDVYVSTSRYVFDQSTNEEQNALISKPKLRRFTIRVWTRNKQGMLSTPAQLTVENAAPSMANILPSLAPLNNALSISWRQYVPPRDIASYRILVDRVNPPRTNGDAIIDTSIAGVNVSYEALNLDAAEHYVQVIPYDTFGIGIGSQIATETPGISPEQFSFFFTNFVPSGIVFSANAATESIAWTAGTLNYDDRIGTPTIASIAAGSAQRIVTAEQLFVYYIDGETQFRSTQDRNVAFRSDRVVIALYSGGPTVNEIYGGKLDGSGIIVRTVGASQLVTGTAVVTETAQIAVLIITTELIDLTAIAEPVKEDIVGTIALTPGTPGPEAIIMSVTLDVTQMQYILFDAKGSFQVVSSTFPGQYAMFMRIREDDVAGAQVDQLPVTVYTYNTGDAPNVPWKLGDLFDASLLTGNKTFVVTAQMLTNPGGTVSTETNKFIADGRKR